MIERIREEDRAEIMRNFERFWSGDRDLEFLRSVHHPMFFIEFGDTAFAARADTVSPGGGEILGYLLGFVAPGGYGYVHFVAVRDDARKLGLASELYQVFTDAVVERGATGRTRIIMRKSL
jgi:ribosomal protein S18 acetylase RimI-like enzyme